MTDRQLNNRLSKLAELEAQKKELENQIESLKNEIKADMGQKEELSTNKYLVKWTSYVQNKLDSRALKEKHPKIYAEFVNPTQCRRFSYKEV